MAWWWDVDDRGASGVPGPAPGQPRGRAPTVALLLGVLRGFGSQGIPRSHRFACSRPLTLREGGVRFALADVIDAVEDQLLELGVFLAGAGVA